MILKYLALATISIFIILSCTNQSNIDSQNDDIQTRTQYQSALDQFSQTLTDKVNTMTDMELREEFDSRLPKEMTETLQQVSSNALVELVKTDGTQALEAIDLTSSKSLRVLIPELVDLIKKLKTVDLKTIKSIGDLKSEEVVATFVLKKLETQIQKIISENNSELKNQKIPLAKNRSTEELWSNFSEQFKKEAIKANPNARLSFSSFRETITPYLNKNTWNYLIKGIKIAYTIKQGYDGVDSERIKEGTEILDLLILNNTNTPTIKSTEAKKKAEEAKQKAEEAKQKAEEAKQKAEEAKQKENSSERAKTDAKKASKPSIKTPAKTQKAPPLPNRSKAATPSPRS